jgi:hypothetical protein
MQPLQPPSAAVSDLNANLWHFNIGPVQIVAPDCITNSTGNVTDYEVIPSTAVSSIMGTSQIDDVLATIDRSLPFTFIGLPNGIKYPLATRSEYTLGTQHPIKDHCPTEFAKLFTDDDSLFDKQPGVVLTLHGDHHNGHVYHHTITGVHTADFYEICAGTVTGSVNHPVSGDPAIGSTYDGTRIEAYETRVGALPKEFAYYFGVRVDVYGSRSRREVVITLFDYESVEMWSGKFIEGAGNTKFDAMSYVARVVGSVET